ncbi:MAG: radical SAM protein [Candidatus Omnitrophica bacterium]|nr:radical SAM protein [Candidatus Omnitrophota bacterium]
MKITFVNFGRENLGIEYISSFLKSSGFKTRLANDPGLFTTEDNVLHSPLFAKFFERKKIIIEEIVASSPDVVAFSVYTSTYNWACEIASAIKKSIDVKVVFGGIHPTILPLQSIKNEFVDFVIRGEGEMPFLELLKALCGNKQFEKVSSLVYKKGQEPVVNELGALIENLDDLPFPDKELFENDARIKDSYMIMASRGCRYGCSYCCESFLNQLYKNKHFRRRSVGSVMNELKIMKEKYKFTEVMFFDSILFTDKEWLKNLLLRFKKEIGVPFRCEGHVNFFDYEVGKILKEGGCYCIDFGIQTFNQKIRKEILKRPEDNLQIHKALDICESLKLRYDVDIIFGIPKIQEEDYTSAIELLNRHRYLNRIKCYNLVYYPGLSLLGEAKRLGALNDKDIADIENGKVNDFFHQDCIKNAQHKRWKEDFQKLFKIYPLLPPPVCAFIIKHKMYRLFHLLPNILVIFIQFINGIIKKDYRFNIYLRNYLYHFKNRFLRERTNRTLKV